MTIWAIGDLHLSFGVPDKKMDVFGAHWKEHDAKIRRGWKETVQPEDLVLLPGDISWAMKIEEAVPDLEWIDSLPGTKVMIRGNHDYWWSSQKKLAEVLPPSIYAIHNNAFQWENVEIGGVRLWDADFHFNDYIVFQENQRANKVLLEKAKDTKENEKIYNRELIRLQMSLKCFKDPGATRIAMTHYPPVDAEMNPSHASDILEENDVSICVFGHLHNVRPGSLPFGTKRGVRYILASCDYLDFKPIRVLG